MSTHEKPQNTYFILVDDNMRDKDHQYKIGLNEGHFRVKPGMLPDVTHYGTYFEDATTICKVHLPLDDPSFEYKYDWCYEFNVNKLNIIEGEQYKICDDNTWDEQGVDTDHRGPFILNHALKYGNLSELEYVIPRLGQRSMSHGFIYAGGNIDINAISWLQQHHPQLLRGLKIKLKTPERLIGCLDLGIAIDLWDSIRRGMDVECFDILDQRQPKLLSKNVKQIIEYAIHNRNIEYLDWFSEHPQYEFNPSDKSIKYASKEGLIDVIHWFLEHPQHFDTSLNEKLFNKTYNHFLQGQFNMFNLLYEHAATQEYIIKYFTEKMENNKLLSTYFEHNPEYVELHKLVCNNCEYCSQ